METKKRRQYKYLLKIFWGCVTPEIEIKKIL